MFVVYIDAQDPDELEYIADVAHEAGLNVIQISDKEFFQRKQFKDGLPTA